MWKTIITDSLQRNRDSKVQDTETKTTNNNNKYQAVTGHATQPLM